MSSTTAMVILAAAAGVGIYYAYARPIQEVKEPAWIEPKHDNSPEVKIFIKPDDAPSHTTFTDVKTGEALNPIKYKPGSFMDRYIKKRGFPPRFLS